MSSEAAGSERQLAEFVSMFPPLFRDALIDDTEFLNKFGASTKARLTLGASGARFDRKGFFDAVRRLYLRLDDFLKVDSIDDVSWKMRFAMEGDHEALVIETDDARLSLPSLWYLSPDTSHRLSRIDKIISDELVLNQTVEGWRDRLAKGALADSEIHAFEQLLASMPSSVERAVEQSIATGESEVSTLVPRAPVYYEMLVGEPGEEDGLVAYAGSRGRAQIDCLLSGDRNIGLKRALLLSAHPIFPDMVDLERFDPAVVVETYRWLASAGDRISQCGGVEIGLRFIDRHPAIQDDLNHLVQLLVDDDASAKGSRLALTSSLIIFVDGELSRVGTLRNRAPYWRRLAAIAHASVLERCIVESVADVTVIADWATSSRGLDFFTQSLIDLRREPRWLPDMISPDQLKAEFMGRATSSAVINESRIVLEPMWELLLGEQPGSARSQLRFPFPWLPGPLEGGVDAIKEMPESVAKDIRTALAAEVLEANSFAGLVNSAFVFKVGNDLADLAADALKRVRYQIRRGAGASQEIALLGGLAIVAAVTRSPTLADEVTVLSRVLRRRVVNDIEFRDTLRVGLLSAACRSNSDEWARAVGDWFIELSMEITSLDDARTAYVWLHRLLRSAPILWTTCARADATLLSILQARKGMPDQEVTA